MKFITFVMNPVRHVGSREYFETERGKLNSVLAFSGLSLGEDGKLRKVMARRATGIQHAPGNNPLGLLPAYRLCDNETYGRLVEKLGVDQVYIPSAGWGLEGAKIRCGSIEQRSWGPFPYAQSQLRDSDNEASRLPPWPSDSPNINAEEFLTLTSQSVLGHSDRIHCQN